MYRLMYTASIAETPAPTIPHISSGNVTDWGIAIALCVLILKEAAAFFKQKDQTETALTNSLIDDLRTVNRAAQVAQTEALERLCKSQENGADALKKIETVVRELSIHEQQSKRELAGIYVELRQLRDQVVVLSERVAAVHARLDSCGIPSAHPVAIAATLRD